MNILKTGLGARFTSSDATMTARNVSVPMVRGNSIFRSRLARLLVAIAGVGLWIGYSPTAQAACFEEGGVEYCRAPVMLTDWRVSACDNQAPYAAAFVAWCHARGGTWQGIDATPDCTGTVPITESNLRSIVKLFWIHRSNNATCEVSTDSGWGQTVTSGQCSTGPPVFRNQLLIGDNRVLTPTAGCFPSVIAQKSRSFQCPKDYSSQMLPTGEEVCKRVIECCSTGSGGSTPNPITHGSGIKTLAETDYRAAGGNLSFTRYYSSTYFFAPRAAAGNETADMGGNWRHNFAKRIYPVTGSSYVSAAMTMPSGEVQYFDSAGNEVVNYGSAKSRLITTAQGYQLRKRDDSTEYYDLSGRLLNIQFINGLTQTLTYSDGTDGVVSGQGGYLIDSTGNATMMANPSVIPAGLLLRVVDSYGRELRFDYENLQARLARVTLPGGGTLQYSYDTNRNLTRITHADGAQRTYIYNESSNTAGTNLPNALTGVLDENNVRSISYFYNSSGQAIREVTPAVGTNTNEYQLSYNNATLTTTVTDPLGAVRTYTFQKDNHSLLKLVNQTQPAAGGSGVVSAATTYDASGNVASRTDFNGNVTTYITDSVTNLETSRTEAYGTPKARTITTQWHTTFRQPLLITEPNRTTAFTYDTSGNVLTRTITDAVTSATRTWTYTYNSFGQVLTVNGPRTDVTDVTTYTYYSCSTGYRCGQLETITDAKSHVTTYLTYNAHGQPLTISDPNSVVTTFVYDTRQRVTSRTVGTETTSFTYYPTGQIQRVTMPDSSYMQYTYDGAHRLTTLTDNEGNRIQYTLDAAGNRTNENVYDPSNALAQTRSRVFDVLGRLSQEIGAANQITTYGYDNNGNVLSVVDAQNRLSTNGYDPLNRLATVTDPLSGVTQYGYDANDNLTSVTDPRLLTTSYAYNGFGDQTQLTSPDTGVTTYVPDSTGNVAQSTDARSKTATYTRDALNRVTHVTYSDQVLQYTYDQGVNGKGRLTQVTEGSGTAQWSYDTQGRVLTKQQVTGPRTFNVGYGYNTVGQLTTVTTPSGQAIGYGYTNGRVTSITVNGLSVLNNVLYAPFGPTRGWQWGNGTFAVREYDTDGRLTLLDSAGASTYTFNPDGTIASRTDDAPVVPTLPGGLTSLAVSTASNRITSTTGTLSRSYGYDLAGNTTGDGARTFTYNDAGRMASATSAGVTTAYLYNALGQRVRKSNTGSTTYFVYDEAGHLLGEYDASGARIQEIVWLGDIPVASIRTNAAGTGVSFFYIHTDHLNAPTKLTSKDTNAIVWRWDHDPFGNGTANQDPDGNGQAVVFNLRFSGQYADSETGLLYNMERYYDPQSGRYVTSDPIGLDGGINTYAYVDSNPISYVDPMGLTKTDKWYGFNNREFQRWFHRCYKQAGDPDADKETMADAYAEWVSRGSPTGGKCDNTPPPPPVPAAQACGDECQDKVATVVVAGGTAYVIYRCARMLPSLFPALWPTIPANLAIP